MSDWGRDAVAAASEMEFVARRAERFAENMAAMCAAATMDIERLRESFVALGAAVATLSLTEDDAETKRPETKE